MAGHKTVRNDHAVIVIRPQQGVTEGKTFHGAGFQTGWRSHMQPVAQLEWPVKQQGNSRNQVAKSILRREADYQRDHAYTSQRRRAQTGQS